MYLDSDVFLGCLFPHDVWGEWARGIQAMPEDKYTSASTLLELAFVLQRDKKESAVDLCERVHRAFPNLQFIPLEAAHMRRAFELQWRYGLNPFDAIHAAVCLDNDARMASTDKSFPRVDGMTLMPVPRSTI